MLVELKNGETLNGHLVTCDTWMNLTLKEVVQTSPVSSLFLAGHLAWNGKAIEERSVGNVYGGMEEMRRQVLAWAGCALLG